MRQPDYRESVQRLSISAHPLRFLFWGTSGPLSCAVLEGLLAAHLRPDALFLAADTLDRSLPAVEVAPLPPPAAADDLELPLLSTFLAHTTLHVAWDAAIPVYAVGRPGGELAALVEELAPDVVCVACFPSLIPAELLVVPRYGFLNVHPSLLPAYRGPAPLFWQLRDGITTTGVTVHWMDAQFDTGAIADRSTLELPAGLSGQEADRRFGQVGAQLLQRVLGSLATGSRPSVAQEAGGSRHSWPTRADFRLDPTWPAQRAFNFMRGTADWGYPYTLPLATETLVLTGALAVDPAATMDAPYRWDGDRVLVRFSPGLLTAGVSMYGA